MSHNVGVFVDVSNLFYSAKSAGVEVNYCRLLDCAVAGRDLIRACAYTGVDPDNPNQRKFIDFLRANGYKVVCKDIHKYEGGRIKANLDIEMAVDIMLLSENLDVVVLVSGDGDFVRLVEAVQMKGVRCEVISFGISTSNELIEAADQFTEISSLPGIFRNAPSGPGVHVRAVQQNEVRAVQGGNGGEVRGVYSYSTVSYNATYHLPNERMRSANPNGAPANERDGRPQQLGNGNGNGNGNGGAHEVDQRVLGSGVNGNGNGNGSNDHLGAHHDFVMPDPAQACLDTHSEPISSAPDRPRTDSLTNGRD